MKGDIDDPFLTMPEKIPYGAFCKCIQCGFVARSTIAFDYYAKKDGDPLKCESCALYGRPIPEMQKALSAVQEKIVGELN